MHLHFSVSQSLRVYCWAPVTENSYQTSDLSLSGLIESHITYTKKETHHKVLFSVHVAKRFLSVYPLAKRINVRALIIMQTC